MTEEFKSWWDLSIEEQEDFAQKVKDEKTLGWEALQAAAEKFGFDATEDMPTIYELVHEFAVTRTCRNCELCQVEEKLCFRRGATNISDLDKERPPEVCKAWKKRRSGQWGD